MAKASSHSHDLQSLLCAGERDYLVRSNGDKVEISNLDGKLLALYFSASGSVPCQLFTPKLLEIYEERTEKCDFEVVLVSGDRDEESFNLNFSKMPWLAIPFSDSSAARSRLNELFRVDELPHVVVLDGKGKVVSGDGVSIIGRYGTDAYPFTKKRLDELKEEVEAAKKNQTLRSVLVSRVRDFVISNDGNKVPVSELEGKIVGLYFWSRTFKSCSKFTPKLIEVYNELKRRGENFEIVLIALHEEEQSFNESFINMPWLALPFNDRSQDWLIGYFELRMLPTLSVIGADGKTLLSNAFDVIDGHGIQAYPFSPRKMAKLAEIEKARLESQTLESFLVSGEQDFVVRNDGLKVPVADLVGKHVLLYFSAKRCPPCHAFLPKLIEAYHEIQARDNAFEVIFVSCDDEQASYDELFAQMPWLALPYGDERKESLRSYFKVYWIPRLIAIGPAGKTITKEARELIMAHGSSVYPFGDEQVKAMEDQVEEMAKGWPRKLSHHLHEEHELLLLRRTSCQCDSCEQGILTWAYCCEECDFDLHPKCALEERKEAGGGDEAGCNENGNGGELKQPSKDGWVCDGEVCYKA